MDKDTIIRLMREAGFTDGMVSIVGAEGFANFARLVIAHERKRLMEDLAPSGSFVSWNNTKCNPLADPMMQSKSAWDDGYASGVAAEREACASIIDDAIGATVVAKAEVDPESGEHTYDQDALEIVLSALSANAAAIRSRT